MSGSPEPPPTVADGLMSSRLPRHASDRDERRSNFLPSVPDLVFCLVAPILAFGAAVRLTQSDGDLAGHIRVGDVILSGHGIPTSSLTSYTVAGVHAPDLAWLAEVILALLYRDRLHTCSQPPLTHTSRNTTMRWRRWPMKKIAITGISIECLERSPFRARYEDFNVRRGEQLFAEGLSFIPGMVDRLRAEAGVQICPLMWAGALPNGFVEARAYARLKGEMLSRLEAEGPFDGVLISGHGALEVEGLGGHGESDYIGAVRQVIGPRVPMGIAFDLHGNITPEIARAGTVFDALRTAPHIDHQQTGWRTADQLAVI